MFHVKHSYIQFLNCCVRNHKSFFINRNLETLNSNRIYVSRETYTKQHHAQQKSKEKEPFKYLSERKEKYGNEKPFH